MPRKSKDQTCFVIAAFPLPQPGTYGLSRFYSSVGEIVSDKLDAATFLSWGEAEEFSEEKGIALNGMTYITQISFSETESKLSYERKTKKNLNEKK